MAFWIILKRNQTQRTLDRQVRVREEIINTYRTINARQRERHLRCFHLSRYVCIPRSHTAIVPASTPFDNNQFDGRRRGEKPLRNSKKTSPRPPNDSHLLKQRPLPKFCRGCRLLRGGRQREPFAICQLLPVGHQAGPRRAQPPTRLGER